MYSITENMFKYLCILLGVLLLISIILLYSVYTKEPVIKEKIIYRDTECKNEEKIYVDIKGEVNKPGVYELNDGDRVNDLIHSASGLKKNSNTRYINLAKVLKDGDVVIIYSNNEVKALNKKEELTKETPCICEETKNDGCLVKDTDTDLININTATKEELMTLSGIGESKAKSIIEYREINGNFNTIEDIIKVSGISENIFASIKEIITV